MTALTMHPAVDRYLNELDRCAAALPRPQRDELVADVRQHLAAGLPATATEADVRNLLDRLGTPHDIVQAASGDAGPSKPPSNAATITFTVAAVFLLVVPFLALPLGVTAAVLGFRARTRNRRLGYPTGIPTACAIIGTIAAVVAMFVLLLLLMLLPAGPTVSTDNPVPMPGPTSSWIAPR